MPRPKNHRANQFSQIAHQRFEDAEILLKRDRLTGAVYLAGYGVECILKALILSSIDEPARVGQVEGSFKGQAGHNLEELKRLYKKESGQVIPLDISKALQRVATWGPDLRYQVSVKSRKDANAFLVAVAEV